MKKKIDHLIVFIKKAYKQRSIEYIISISFTLIAVFGMMIMGAALYSQFSSRVRQNAIENDKYNPTLELALRLARFLDIPVEKLFILED